MNGASILYLTRDEVRALLPSLPGQVELAADTYRAMAAGQVELPPKPGVHPRRDAFIHAMPAYLRNSDVAAVKWVSGYRGNPALGLSYISGVIVLNDPGTGAPLAIMDAAEITAARTAAASGACVEAFAPSGWRTVALLGAGEQGRYHAEVLLALRADAEIRAYDPRPERVAELPGSVVPGEDPRECVAGAHVVVTAGPIVESPPSSLRADWLAERFLALPIDFDFYFHASAVASADSFLVDDVAQFEYYRRQGHFREWPSPDRAVGEALVADGRPARVICANLGVGSLDAAFAAAVYRRALEEQAGTALPT